MNKSGMTREEEDALDKAIVKGTLYDAERSADHAENDPSPRSRVPISQNDTDAADDNVPYEDGLPPQPGLVVDANPPAVPGDEAQVNSLECVIHGIALIVESMEAYTPADVPDIVFRTAEQCKGILRKLILLKETEPAAAAATDEPSAEIFDSMVAAISAMLSHNDEAARATLHGRLDTVREHITTLRRTIEARDQCIQSLEAQIKITEHRRDVMRRPTSVLDALGLAKETEPSRIDTDLARARAKIDAAVKGGLDAK